MKTVIMPTELTAENGAKGAMMGEFYEKIPMYCPECDESIPEPNCKICNGTGEYIQEVNISWTVIKQIYRMAVKVCGKPVSDNE